jgi:hypothetical protein
LKNAINERPLTVVIEDKNDTIPLTPTICFSEVPGLQPFQKQCYYRWILKSIIRKDSLYGRSLKSDSEMNIMAISPVSEGAKLQETNRWRNDTIWII